MHPRELLAYHQIEPKKSLGQNFLFDPSLLHALTVDAGLLPDDHVLEIGPGLGTLTRELARAAARVVAVELDGRLIPILRAELAALRNVELRHADILTLDPATLFDRPYKVVANVPYYITGAILQHLLGATHKPTTLLLTVQKEVAERMTAAPGDLSLLAVSVQFYGTARIVRTIGAQAFWPRPKVASSCVRIDLHAQPPAVDEARFFAVVRAGFGQKRKQIKNNLRALGLDDAQIQAALRAAAIDGQRRAETLTVAEWLALTDALAVPPRANSTQ